MKKCLLLVLLLFGCTVDPVPNTTITFKMDAGDFYSCSIDAVDVQLDGVKVTTLNNPGNMGNGWVRYEAFVVGGPHSYSARSRYGRISWERTQIMVQPPFGKTVHLCCGRGRCR